jgi:hypothetical protein
MARSERSLRSSALSGLLRSQRQSPYFAMSAARMSYRVRLALAKDPTVDFDDLVKKLGVSKPHVAHALNLLRMREPRSGSQ